MRRDFLRNIFIPAELAETFSRRHAPLIIFFTRIYAAPRLPLERVRYDKIFIYVPRCSFISALVH